MPPPADKSSNRQARPISNVNSCPPMQMWAPSARALSAFGDVHDKCTRNHQRKRIEDLVWDVEQHFWTNGPWHYKLSHLYYTPEVTAAVDRIIQEQQLPRAA